MFLRYQSCQYPTRNRIDQLSPPFHPHRIPICTSSLIFTLNPPPSPRYPNRTITIIKTITIRLRIGNRPTVFQRLHRLTPPRTTITVEQLRTNIITARLFPQLFIEPRRKIQTITKRRQQQCHQIIGELPDGPLQTVLFFVVN